MREDPKPQQVYRHFKGDLYRIITIACHSETGERLVVYTRNDIEDIAYARPLSMFMSEVDKAKYPYVKERYRFTLVSDEAAGEDNPGIDPMLESFLDADSYEEKLAIFSDMKLKVDEQMLSTIAMSLDIELSKEDIEDQYKEIMWCLKTMERFECNRLRR